MSEKLKIPYPVIVEGKYDKIKLSGLIDATIFITDGFGLFKDEAKQRLFKNLAAKTKVLVLTDADGAGLVIRNFLTSLLPKERVVHLYIPPRPGKEKRKSAPSAEGLLGVEGLDADLIRSIFAPFAEGACEEKQQAKPITKADFYRDGFSGGPGSAGKRLALCRRLDLPANLSAGALLEALNLLYGYEAYLGLVRELAEAPLETDSGDL
ncbi:MAG: DUF4093 domain-containing protein [Clostridiales bacterium]|nr:DUF4093 domain-containing protein [Clostridiales bacterium]